MTIENTKNINDLSFEEAYNRLTETAAKLEQGGLTLEESLALFEEGTQLAHYCEELLAKAELKVSQLLPATVTSGFTARTTYSFGDGDDEDNAAASATSDTEAEDSDEDEDWSDDDLRNALNELKF